MKIDNNNSSWFVPGFPLFIAKDDRERYNKFKTTGTKPIDKYEKDAMEIISILERLGFSLDEIGTYLYKELIMSMYQEIKNNEEITEKIDDMGERLTKKLTHDLLEMERDLYEELVKESIDSIDGSNVDIELSEKVFKDSIYNINANAFEIASYYMKNKKEEKKSKKGLFLSRVFNLR